VFLFVLSFLPSPVVRLVWVVFPTRRKKKDVVQMDTTHGRDNTKRRDNNFRGISFSSVLGFMMVTTTWKHFQSRTRHVSHYLLLHYTTTLKTLLCVLPCVQGSFTWCGWHCLFLLLLCVSSLLFEFLLLAASFLVQQLLALYSGGDSSICPTTFKGAVTIHASY
jgi:hypothetical protein